MFKQFSTAFSILFCLLIALTTVAFAQVSGDSESEELDNLSLFPVQTGNWPEAVSGTVRKIVEEVEIGEMVTFMTMRVGRQAFILQRFDLFNVNRKKQKEFSLILIDTDTRQYRVGIGMFLRQGPVSQITEEGLQRYVGALKRRYGGSLVVDEAKLVKPEDTRYSTVDKTFIEIVLRVKSISGWIEERQIFYEYLGRKTVFVLSGPPEAPEELVTAFREEALFFETLMN